MILENPARHLLYFRTYFKNQEIWSDGVASPEKTERDMLQRFECSKAMSETIQLNICYFHASFQKMNSEISNWTYLEKSRERDCNEVSLPITAIKGCNPYSVEGLLREVNKAFVKLWGICDMLSQIKFGIGLVFWLALILTIWLITSELSFVTWCLQSFFLMAPGRCFYEIQNFVSWLIYLWGSSLQTTPCNPFVIWGASLNPFNWMTSLSKLETQEMTATF